LERRRRAGIRIGEGSKEGAGEAGPVEGRVRRWEGQALEERGMRRTS